MAEKEMLRYYRKSTDVEREWIALLTPEQVDTLYDELTTLFPTLSTETHSTLISQAQELEDDLFAAKPANRPAKLAETLQAIEHPLLVFYLTLLRLNRANVFLKAMLDAYPDQWDYAQPDDYHTQLLHDGFSACSRAGRRYYWPFDERSLSRK